MKKYLIAGLFAALIVFSLVSCRPGENQPVSTPDGASYTAAPEVTEAPPTVTPIETPSPTQVPDFTSAVEFLSRKWVISDDTQDEKNTKEPEKLEPGQRYIGGTPNYAREKYSLLILDKDQSRKLLTAEDLTSISYRQSECLPIMLRWDDVSVLDMYEDWEYKAWRAYYYYLEDSTVIIVNDAARRYERFDGYDKPWILVIPKADEDNYRSWIPPKGTVVKRTDRNASLYEPYYERLREYFDADPEAPALVGRLRTSYEKHMTDYTEWMNWRTEHPDYYDAWKQLSYPEKPLANDSDPYAFFRADYLDWCSVFRDADEEAVIHYDETGENRVDLPKTYLQIKQYGVPKEEMLEFVKWMKWSGAIYEQLLNEEDVEVLYSNDDDAVRRRFAAKNAVYFEGKVYSQADVLRWMPPYDIARMFTHEEFNNYAPEAAISFLRGITSARRERIENAWDEYGRISREDEGELDIDSAVRVLEDFMKIYEEIKYSPDALAGDPVWPYDPDYFLSYEEGQYLRFCKLPFDEIFEQFATVLSPDIRDNYRLKTSNTKCQFTYFIWDGWFDADGHDMNYHISANPKFYNGTVELFGDGYALADHIRIVENGNDRAEVTLTAKNRSGDGEQTFNATFSKYGGRWYISGGSILELLVPVE